MHRDELVATLCEMLRDRSDIVAAYLYGSRARGTATTRSDLDLAVLFAEPPSTRIGGPADRLASELEAKLRVPVEVVALESAPADLVHRVLRDGILVHESDRGARVRFEVARRREYLDLLPVLQEYRRAATRAADRT